MLSGYRLAGHVIDPKCCDFPVNVGCSTTWPFLDIAARVDACDPDLLRELHLGRSRFGRKLRRRLPGYKQRSEG